MKAAAVEELRWQTSIFATGDIDMIVVIVCSLDDFDKRSALRFKTSGSTIERHSCTKAKLDSEVRFARIQ